MSWSGIGVDGYCQTNDTGVYGHSESGLGIDGYSSRNTGIFGHTSSWSNPGVHGNSNTTGVYGDSAGSWGVGGRGPYGGLSGLGTGQYSNGIFAKTEGLDGVALVADAGPWITPVGRARAGYFNGDVTVTGKLNKPGGGFRVDHPRDPANKYLNHSFVESDKMKNVYDGVAELGTDGTASVELPEWFEDLNEDFCYQLTAVGRAAPDLYVAEEVYDNRFKIAGGDEGGMRVCWQVTGTRKDAWAASNSLEVEEEKSPEERGRYVHPHLYNQPEERRVGVGPREELPEVPPSFELPQPLEREAQPIELFDRQDMQAELGEAIDELRAQIEELREELRRRQ